MKLTFEWCENQIALPEGLTREQKTALNQVRTAVLANLKSILNRKEPVPLMLAAVGEQFTYWGRSFQTHTGSAAPIPARAGAAAA